MVYWFTGLSGAGKTTLGRLFYERLKEKYSNTVFLDGDALRDVFGNDLGHSLLERKRSAMRNARLCKMLSDQGIQVVCATIALFKDCQIWNRENINGYFEIYIKVSMDTLIQRDPKGLYKKALNGDIKNVVGIDIPFDEPYAPHIIVENNGDFNMDIHSKNIYKYLLDEKWKNDKRMGNMKEAMEI